MGNIAAECYCMTDNESRQLYICKGVSPDMLGNTTWEKMSMLNSSDSFYMVFVPNPEPVPPPKLLMTLIARAQSTV